MRLLVVLIFLCLILLATNGTTDIRQRFEGLIGRRVYHAWRKIDREGFLFYFD